VRSASFGEALSHFPSVRPLTSAAVGSVSPRENMRLLGTFGAISVLASGSVCDDGRAGDDAHSNGRRQLAQTLSLPGAHFFTAPLLPML
jgi:hypothetical protein